MSGVDLPGFADPVADSQRCFRAVLDAMSHPGRAISVGEGLRAPHPFDPATAAILLTLVDVDSPLWLDPAASGATEWLRFHCGAPFVAPDAAMFAVCLGLPALTGFNWGSHDGPEESTTVVVQCRSLEDGPLFRLSGPGLRAPETVRLGALPDDFIAAWRANHAAYPRGVDLLLCAGTRLLALPRSCMIEAA